MQIILTPNDIIQRCLWDRYQKYCIFRLSNAEIIKIIEENKPISMSEEDAYAIGLLKVIETDNLIHRFNESILDMLQIKSNVIDDDLYINKNVAMKDVLNFMKKFPEQYNAPFNYKQALVELIDYINTYEEKLSKLELTTVNIRERQFTYFKSKDVKKALTL